MGEVCFSIKRKGGRQGEIRLEQSLVKELVEMKRGKCELEL